MDSENTIKHEKIVEDLIAAFRNTKTTNRTVTSAGPESQSIAALHMLIHSLVSELYSVRASASGTGTCKTGIDSIQAPNAVDATPDPKDVEST